MAIPTSIFAVVCIVFISHLEAAPAPPALPPCPTEFVAKFNNATAFCEDESSEALFQNPGTVKPIVAHTAVNRNYLKRFRRAVTAAIIMSNVTSNVTTTMAPNKTDIEDSDEEEEEADPEIMLCTFGKLKETIPILEVVEKICSSPSPVQIGPVPNSPPGPPGATTTTTTTTSKPKDDLDADLQLASCLEEKLETMCPELSSVV